MLNCSQIDATLDDIVTVVADSDWGFFLACGALFVLSVLLLFAGELVVRPVGALLVGSAAAVGAFMLSGLPTPPPMCEIRLATAGGAVILGVTLTLCLLRTGFALLGAAGFAAVAHVVYDAFATTSGGDATAATARNGTAAEEAFELFGRSGYYYLVMFGATTAGGVVAYVQRKQFVRISTSLVGAAGLVLLSQLVTHRATASDLPGLAAVAILAVGTSAGVAAQWQLSRRKKKGKKTKQEDKAST